MTSLVYTLDGRLIPYKGRQKHSIPFVRKMINVAWSGGVVELAIAKLLMRNPQKNVVKVLKISTKTKKPYIDYQKLDTNYKYKKNMKKDIKNGLINLHRLNIIYLDIRDDNFGYDPISKEWRIFDFDVSGICKKSKLKWNIEPSVGAAAKYYFKSCSEGVKVSLWDDIKLKKNIIRKIKELCKKKSLTKIYEIIYLTEFGDILYP